MTINNMHLLLISLCTRKNKITKHKEISYLEEARFPLFTWPTYFGGLAGRKPGNIRMCIFLCLFYGKYLSSNHYPYVLFISFTQCYPLKQTATLFISVHCLFAEDDHIWAC